MIIKISDLPQNDRDVIIEEIRRIMGRPELMIGGLTECDTDKSNIENARSIVKTFSY